MIWRDRALLGALLAGGAYVWIRYTAFVASLLLAYVVIAVLTLEARENELLQIIDDFANADECVFDHHGYCQTHGWMTTTRECPNIRAARVLPEEAPRVS